MSCLDEPTNVYVLAYIGPSGRVRDIDIYGEQTPTVIEPGARYHELGRARGRGFSGAREIALRWLERKLPRAAAMIRIRDLAHRYDLEFTQVEAAARRAPR